MVQYPTPEHVDIMAEVAEFLTDQNLIGMPSSIQSLAQYAGAGTDERAANGRVSAKDERVAMVRLSAIAIARIYHLDRLARNGKVSLD